MSWDSVTLAVTCLSIVILGLSKGGFAGLGMLSMPLMSTVLPPGIAAGILLPVLILQDAVSAWSYRRSFDAWNLRLMLPPALAGIAAAAILVSHLATGLFEVALGAISVLFGAERIVRQLAGPVAPKILPRAFGRVCGAAAGFTSMIAHAGVPPFQFYVLPQRLPRDIFVGTSVMFYAAVNLAKLPAFLSLGQVTAASLRVSLLMFPLAAVSVLGGIWLVRRIPGQGILLVAAFLMAGLGVLLIMRGLGAA